MTRSAETMIIQEVAPRDGLQIEPTWVETSEKVQLIEMLAFAGFSGRSAVDFKPGSP